MTTTVGIRYPVTTAEYAEIEEQFDNLVHYAGWRLMRWHYDTNLDEHDIAQDLRIALCAAASYYKRETYVLACFAVLDIHITPPHIEKLNQLKDRWATKRRNREFTADYETMLSDLVNQCVPIADRPDRNATLVFDGRFAGYAKKIMWNAMKTIGKQYDREKPIRTGMVSIDEFSGCY